MSIRISFDLDDKDLAHLSQLMRGARKNTAALDEAQVIEEARELLERTLQVKPPDFMLERLKKLELLARMLEDADWRLPAKDRKRILTGLAYFSQGEDIIPDSIPGLGFLDDAILIELITRELKPEIHAYEEFCAARDNHKAADASSKLSKQSWLEERRKALQERLRRRRHTAKQRSGGLLRLLGG